MTYRGSRQEENPAHKEDRGTGMTARRSVCAQGRLTGLEHSVAFEGACHIPRSSRSAALSHRYISVFNPEIDVVEREMAAWFGGRQAIRRTLAAYMARLAATIGIVGAKAHDSIAAGRRQHHATGSHQRHPAPKSAFSAFHCRTLYYTSPAQSISHLNVNAGTTSTKLHQAFLTQEALANIATTTLKNLDDYFAGAPLENEICYRCLGSGGANQSDCPHRANGRCQNVP